MLCECVKVNYTHIQCTPSKPNNGCWTIQITQTNKVSTNLKRNTHTTLWEFTQLVLQTKKLESVILTSCWAGCYIVVVNKQTPWKQTLQLLDVMILFMKCGVWIIFTVINLLFTEMRQICTAAQLQSFLQINMLKIVLLVLLFLIADSVWIYTGAVFVHQSEKN